MSIGVFTQRIGVARGAFLMPLLALVTCLPMVLQSAPSAAATTTLNPIADAYVEGGAWANDNFGTSTGLFTQTSNNGTSSYDSYLKFDTSSTGGLGSVASAKLRISASLASGSIGMSVYAVSDTSWAETAITWNNKPARGSALASTTVTGNSFIYYELDVSSYLIAEKAAGRNIVSFALHNPANSSKFIWMQSRETTSGNPPQLVLILNPKPTSLAPNPLAITAGASGTLTATLSPTPTAAGTLSVTSANTAVATAPASVGFAAGQTSVPIPVTALAVGSTIVTASANSGSASATVNVTPAPPTVTSLAPPALSLTQGASGTLTVTISAAQAAPTTVSLASGNSGVAFVDASVTVPAGAVSAPVPVAAVSPGTAQVTASLNGSSASSQVTVTAAPPSVVSLVPVLSRVAVGGNTSLNLTLSSAQPADTVVSLAASPAGIVTVPANVTVPAGQTSIVVPVASVALGQAGITATLNVSSASAVINVVPPPAQLVAVEPPTYAMTVGATSSFTVRINAAQLANTEIALSADNPAVLQLPASVTVAQGQTSASFTATALAIGSAIITAALDDVQKTAAVQIAQQAVAIVSLVPSPLPLQQAATGSLTAALNAAQATDTAIALANSAPGIVQVPATVTVPAGATAATVTVTALAAGAAQVTASVNSTTASAAIEVAAPLPVVSAITPSTLTLPKGTPGVLRVTVSRAPNVATAVTLASRDASVASVPATVNIPAGELFADFPVAANSSGQATITASLNGGAASAAVTITPEELAALTLAPASAYVGESVQFTATGTMTDGTSQDFTTQVPWTSSNTSIATIASTGVASALASGQTTITASFIYKAAQTGQVVTITAATTLTVKQPVALMLTAPTTTLLSGASTTVTVASSDPAPAGGLAVTLSATGSGTATFPPTVTISANGTSVAFTLTGVAAGQVTVIATAANRLPGVITFTIQPAFAITSFTPASGPVGTAVTINGTGFDPIASNNQVRFNAEAAVIVNASPVVLNVIVPLRATTGPITVTNSLGTATSATPFTVQDREAFDITLTPLTVQVPPGGNGATRVTLVSTGLNAYPYAAAVTASGLPAGVTAVFDKPAVALNQDAILTLPTQATASAGSYPVTVTATGQSGVTTLTRSKTLTLQVLAAGATTVTGRVLRADDGAPFVGARVRLGGAAVFTDETGTYRFVSPPVAGDQVLLVDGSPANTPTAEFPSAIPMPVMIVAGQDNKALTVFIGRVDPTKFTAIVPGAVASVTNPDIANFSLNIPQGVTIFGFDGQPVDKINVRVVPVDRLPIRPIPEGQTSRFVYLFYFFREGGGTPTQPVPVTLPNDVEALPGTQVEMWYYDESSAPDPNSNQWRLMGFGTVSANGKSVVSDPGVGIPKFCCGAVRLINPNRSIETVSTGGNAGNGDGTRTCNPVDLGSGNALVFRPRPFGISKLMSVNPNCQYRSTDARIGLFGRGMSFTYDWFAEAFSNTIRVTNPAGAQFILSLEADGKFRSSSGRSGSIEMEVTPTASGRTLRLADGTEYDFDAAGRLLAVRDLNGNSTSFQLDANGFPTSMTDAAGRVYTFTLIGSAPNVNISRITDPAGRVVSFEYDASRRLIRYTDQGGNLIQLEYDANNRVVRKTDPRNAVETIEYDAAGRATRELLPENATQQFAYTTVGATVTETRHTDENGNLTTYRWNGLGYLTQVIDALGRVTKIEPDPVNNLMTKRTDPAGRVTQYFYNARGDLIRIVDAQGQQTLIEYDTRFRKPTRIENALTHATTMAYDAKGNLTSLTSAENETTSFTYTAKGQLETVTDPLMRVTSFAYDADGNLLTATNPANETVTLRYDLANRLEQVTDALNRIASFTYDSLDRVTEVRDAAAGFTRFAYDANDNLVSATDPNDNPVERNLYDLRNRLTQRTDAKNLTTTYLYDGVGNVTRMTDRRGRVTDYTYDALNRITQVSDADGRITNYIYDLAGNLAHISDSHSGDILVSYDSLNRLTEVVTPQGSVQYAYDAIGRRTSRTISGDDVTAYTYDKVNRLKTVTLRGRTVTYHYDLAGRLIEKVLPNGLKASYQYDAADRATSIAYTKPDNSVVESVAYSYDAGGQRITKTQGQASPGETPLSATYDEANRLTAITLNGEPFTLSYDENGNLASKSGATSGITNYTWTARNQLASISSPSASASFKYDALGRRIEKTVNGDTTGFLYDGPQAIAELKGSALEIVYHTGLEIDEVLARYGASGNKTLLGDALMSVIAQANDDQSMSNFYVYSPYGESITLGADDGNSIQYTGRENDGTGLYFYRARYYDPVLKRFISEDPIGLSGGLNMHAYVEGNPISFVDPNGMLIMTTMGPSLGLTLEQAETVGGMGNIAIAGASPALAAQGVLVVAPGVVTGAGFGLAGVGSGIQAAGSAIASAATSTSLVARIVSTGLQVLGTNMQAVRQVAPGLGSAAPASQVARATAAAQAARAAEQAAQNSARINRPEFPGLPAAIGAGLQYPCWP